MIFYLDRAQFSADSNITQIYKWIECSLNLGLVFLDSTKKLILIRVQSHLCLCLILKRIGICRPIFRSIEEPSFLSVGRGYGPPADPPPRPVPAPSSPFINAKAAAVTLKSECSYENRDHTFIFESGSRRRTKLPHIIPIKQSVTQSR